MKPALILMTLAVLASCKKTEEPTPTPEPKPEPELVPIQIATTMTRATDYAFETGDNVGLFVVNEPNSLQLNGDHVETASSLSMARSGTPERRSIGRTRPPRRISTATILTRPLCHQSQRSRSRSAQTRAQRAAIRCRI